MSREQVDLATGEDYWKNNLTGERTWQSPFADSAAGGGAPPTDAHSDAESGQAGVRGGRAADGGEGEGGRRKGTWSGVVGGNGYWTPELVRAALGAHAEVRRVVCVCVCVCVCDMHCLMHANMYICIYIYIYIHTYASIHPSIHAHMQRYIHRYIHTFIHYICIHTHTCTHTHTHRCLTERGRAGGATAAAQAASASATSVRAQACRGTLQPSAISTRRQDARLGYVLPEVLV